jgi:rhodanese-related sulfurtransferase/CBS domain-containing protein
VVASIDTDRVRELAEQGAVLIEVLPKTAYDIEHLPGAISLPLEDMSADAVRHLDCDRPTIAYCYDYQCDLSARAAHRLESLGFSEVYDYTASKTAWMALGLPAEGSRPDSRRAGAAARRDVPTVPLDSTVGDLVEQLGDELRAIVLDDERVVLGVVRRDALDLEPITPVETVMQPAPPSVRPSIPVDELAESMEQDARSYVIVSHLDGTFVGVIERDDLHGRH